MRPFAYQGCTVYSNSFGVSERSLRSLRDSLCLCYNDPCVVYRVESADGEHVRAYGYMIVNLSKGHVYFTGDGFRGDNQGEGGAAHRDANTLMRVFGMWPATTDWCSPVDYSTEPEVLEQFGALARAAHADALDKYWVRPIDQKTY